MIIELLAGAAPTARSSIGLVVSRGASLPVACVNRAMENVGLRSYEQEVKL